MQPFLNMILLAVLISFSSLAEAEALIAFDQISCTSDILPFVKAEIGNALDLVVQTSAWLIPPLYDEIIQGYVENLFGPGDPISSPRLVFLGLLDFESAFVEVSELSGQEDLLVFCSPRQYGTEVIISDGEAMYWDGYLEQLTDASDVDTLRNGLSIAGVSHDQNRVKPSTLTLATWWLNKARAAMYQDTGIISAYDYRTRISAWRQYPELAPEFPNIVEVDWYKLNNHQMLHELMHTWPAVGGDDAIFEELIEDVEYGYTGCREISGKTGDDGPEKNADSYIYLAILIDLYVNMLSTVSKDGNTIKLFPGLTLY